MRIDRQYFEIVHNATNGSYYEVRPTKAGITTASAFFLGVFNVRALLTWRAQLIELREMRARRSTLPRAP